MGCSSSSEWSDDHGKGVVLGQYELPEMAPFRENQQNEVPGSPESHDHQQRQDRKGDAPHTDRCNVYFWTKSSKKRWSTPSASIYGCCHHSMIAFEYEEEVLVCDAVNQAGQLTGRCRSMGIKEFHKKYPKKRRIVQRNLSIELVKETVRRMEKSGPYDHLWNNCQKWLKEMLKHLNMHTAPDPGDT
ncbi:uncharacterized protein LOC144139467 [Haemaphysalis longicornis]